MSLYIRAILLVVVTVLLSTLINYSFKIKLPYSSGVNVVIFMVLVFISNKFFK